MMGLMRVGATKADPNRSNNMGIMTVGARPEVPKEELKRREVAAAEQKLKDEAEMKKAIDKLDKQKIKKEEVEVTQTSTDVEVEIKEPLVETPETVDTKTEEEDLTQLHVQTLKKKALEAGYEGEAFDRESLIAFLENKQITNDPS